MSKTIRIIQSCNHMTRTESYEYKEAKVYRQERRQSEKSYSISSSKFMYYGNWTKETSNDKSYYINSSSTDRCSVFFYGDNACLYGLKHPDGGNISVYLDGVKVDTVNSQGALTETYPIIIASELEYGPHVIEIGVGTFDPAKPYYPTSTSEVKISAAIKFPVFYIEFAEILADYAQDYDTIIENEIVSNIEKVYQFDPETDEYVEFKDEVDFIFLPSNKIQWISINRPRSGIPYYVKYVERVIDFKTLPFKECEKCGGYGWYSSFQNINSLRPSETSGIQKIAEDIIKIILSPYNEETGYGSKFKSLTEELYTDTESLETYGITEIGRITDWYIENQNNEKSLGAEFEAEDLLEELYISEIYYDDRTNGLHISILVKNKKEEYAQETLDL